MADVNVEFGAKDTGLEATLKTVQEQMTKLEAEVKSGTLSFEDLAKKMRELQQAERMAEKFSQLGGQVKQSGEEAKQTEQKISALSEILGQTATSAMSLDARIASVQMKLAELRDKTTSADLSMEELEDTLRKISTLESAERRLKGIGDASQESKPKVDSLGNTALDAGQKSNQSAGLFDESFQKIAGAFTVGNLAAMGFEKAIDLAFSAARAVVDAFGQALDLGSRLNDLSARTGETAGKLLVLEQAFKDSGLSADQVGVAINKLQNFMAEAQAGGEAQAQAMQRLGISMADLAGKTPTQQMEVFAQAISKIEDPTQRAAMAGDVFGEKLGGRLLPLLTQFSPALDDAGTKVGSLANVMDENAGTFDRVGESIDAAKGKLTAFAAGILSETVPAVQELGNSLEMVDAAGLGEKIGSALAPILRGITQDIKILNEFISSLGQGIRSLIEPIAGTAQKFDELAQKIGNVAKIVEVLIPNQLSPMGVVLNGVTDATGRFAEKQTEAGAAIEQTGVKAQQTAEKIAAIPAPMQGANENILEINNSLTATGGLLDEQKIKLGTINSEYEIWNGLTDQGYDKTKDTLEAKSEIAAKLQESIELEIALNNAKASGNQQLANELESRKQSVAAQERIIELTEQFKKSMPEESAKKMAQELVKSESALESATEQAGKLKTVMDLVAESKMDAPIETFSERLKQARSGLSDMKDFIGEDMNNMTLKNIMSKLGIDAPGLEDSSESLKRVETAVDALGKADPADITPTVDPDKPRNKLEAVKEFLNGIKGVDATPKIDQDKAQDAIKGIEKQIKDLGNKDIDLKIRPKINKEALKQEVDLALQSSKGTEILTKINEAVVALRELVTKIEVKLPQQALSY